MNEFNYHESNMIRRWVNFINWDFCYFLLSDYKPNRRPESICTLFWSSVWAVLMAIMNVAFLAVAAMCAGVLVFFFGTLLFSPLLNSIFGVYWTLPDSGLNLFELSVVSMGLWSLIGFCSWRIGRLMANESHELNRVSEGAFDIEWWAKDLWRLKISTFSSSVDKEPGLVTEFIRSKKQKICPRITYHHSSQEAS